MSDEVRLPMTTIVSSEYLDKLRARLTAMEVAMVNIRDHVGHSGQCDGCVCREAIARAAIGRAK